MMLNRCLLSLARSTSGQLLTCRTIFRSRRRRLGMRGNLEMKLLAIPAANVEVAVPPPVRLHGRDSLRRPPQSEKRDCTRLRQLSEAKAVRRGPGDLFKRVLDLIQSKPLEEPSLAIG